VLERDARAVARPALEPQLDVSDAVRLPGRGPPAQRDPLAAVPRDDLADLDVAFGEAVVVEPEPEPLEPEA
jgi:hypothetical protein